MSVFERHNGWFINMILRINQVYNLVCILNNVLYYSYEFNAIQCLRIPIIGNITIQLPARDLSDIL